MLECATRCDCDASGKGASARSNFRPAAPAPLRRRQQRPNNAAAGGRRSAWCLSLSLSLFGASPQPASQNALLKAFVTQKKEHQHEHSYRCCHRPGARRGEPLVSAPLGFRHVLSARGLPFVSRARARAPPLLAMGHRIPTTRLTLRQPRKTTPRRRGPKKTKNEIRHTISASASAASSANKHGGGSFLGKKQRTWLFVADPGTFSGTPENKIYVGES